MNDFAGFCLTDAVGRPLRQAPFHRDLQAFLDGHPRALIELPRDHGKSVQICLRILWELGHDPSLRIKIVCASDELAVERCRYLRDAIESNKALHAVFPHLRPSRPWGVTRFTIERPANVIGPSVAALGIGSVATGTRADLLICDDVVDVKALRSRADRERVKSYFRENLMNLLEPTGRFWGLFTPWHVDDLNANLKTNSAYALFRRAVGPNLEPVWPEKWPADRLQARFEEIGSRPFARAFRLECVPEDEVVIKAEWVRFWLASGGRESPDGSNPELKIENYKLQIANWRDGYEQVVLAVDPAVSCSGTADRTALVTLGRTANNEVHCLEASARRVLMPDLIALIDDANQRYNPEVILFESNAAFAGIRDLLARQARYGPKIKPVNQSKNKMSRIQAFSVPVETGTFLLRGERRGSSAPIAHSSQQELYDEMTSFPFGEHDDLVDAAATGVAYLVGNPEPKRFVELQCVRMGLIL